MSSTILSIINYGLLAVHLFLAENTKEIQICQQRKQELERTIQYHENMKMYKTIPRKFKPPNVPTTMKPNIPLTDDFNRKYEKLFFDHLDKVITNDTLTLELTKSRIDNILTQTETYLSSLQISPHTLSDLYHQFLTNNHITHHTPLPVLQAKLPTTTLISPSQSTTTTNQNRDWKPTGLTL